MKDSEFHQLADEQLASIEQAIEDSGADIDFETSGNVMTLEFEDRTQIIINKQELFNCEKRSISFNKNTKHKME